MNNTGHRSTERVLDILELLSQNSSGYSLTEISALLNAPKSSLFPIIHTMQDRAFIRLDTASNKYRIGSQAYLTGSAYKSDRPIYDIIKNNMQKLVDCCHETCHLGILSGDSVLYIAKIESENAIMLRSHIGQRLPAYCTGIGKALIYPLGKKELEQLYPNGLTAYTPTTITSFDLLCEELEEVAKTGYAYENSELTEGIRCIAVPLCNGNSIIASTSIAIPAYRATPEKLEEIRTVLDDYKEAVECSMKQLNITDNSYLI